MYLKSIVFLVTVILTFASCKEQTSNVEDKLEVEEVNISVEKEAVAKVMKNYKDAIQNLTTKGTMELFTKEATVFESGGSEGTYANYVAHHLGPELGHFNSFIFSDYKIDVVIDMPFAFTTETYNYAIDIKENKEKGWEARVIKKKGVATSNLKKIDEKWMITKTHSSSRAIRKASH
ncbi:MAG: nuclear transport factor 2 family protein [Flavobacteriaceae bacterium]|nr:nuclear transport factor 2 family protein [Flavobacteriaceae bacterium]